MGSHTTARVKVDVSAAAVHRTLRRHPNFIMPVAPKGATPEQTAEFVIEAIARYVSPPKLPDENDEFECIDIATAIRQNLGPEILAAVRRAARRESEAGE